MYLHPRLRGRERTRSDDSRDRGHRRRRTASHRGRGSSDYRQDVRVPDRPIDDTPHRGGFRTFRWRARTRPHCGGTRTLALASRLWSRPRGANDAKEGVLPETAAQRSLHTRPHLRVDVVPSRAHGDRQGEATGVEAGSQTLVELNPGRRAGTRFGEVEIVENSGEDLASLRIPRHEVRVSLSVVVRLGESGALLVAGTRIIHAREGKVVGDRHRPALLYVLDQPGCRLPHLSLVRQQLHVVKAVISAVLDDQLAGPLGPHAMGAEIVYSVAFRFREVGGGVRTFAYESRGDTIVDDVYLGAAGTPFFYVCPIQETTIDQLLVSGHELLFDLRGVLVAGGHGNHLPEALEVHRPGQLAIAFDVDQAVEATR